MDEGERISQKKNIPRWQEKKKKNNEWITKATLKQVRDKAWKKYRRYQSGTNFSEYQKILNQVVSMIRTDQRVQQKSLIKSMKKNPK